MHRRLVCMDYSGGKRVMNYFRDGNQFSPYYYNSCNKQYNVYNLIKTPEDIAFNQEMAREDYKSGNGRVVFYEELYDWE